MLAAEAGSTHFLIAPRVPLLPSLSVTRYCKKSLDRAISASSLADTLLCRLVSPLCAALFSRINQTVWCAKTFNILICSRLPLPAVAIRLSPSFSAHHSKPEPNKRRNLSATPCLRRSRPSRRRRKPWRSTMKRRRNFSLTSCQGNSCKWVEQMFADKLVCNISHVF